MIEIRADGNDMLGMGHYSRCISITDELMRKGIPFIWVCSRDADPAILKSKEFPFHQMQRSSYREWCMDEETAFVRQHGISTLFADSYFIQKDDFTKLRRETRVIYLDDLVAYACDADEIINYNIEASEELYQDDNIQNRAVYTGVRYFPLKRELLAYRKTTISRAVQNVLITTGGTDPYDCIHQILSSIRATDYPEITFRIIIGLYTDPVYQEHLREEYGKHGNIIFLPWGQNMGERFKEADLVIAPGSSTTYEALSTGVPCLTFEFVENHHNQCVALDNQGIAPWLGLFSETVTENHKKSIRDAFENELSYPTREAQYKRFSGLFDGKGVERIVKIITGQQA